MIGSLGKIPEIRYQQRHPQCMLFDAEKRVSLDGFPEHVGNLGRNGCFAQRAADRHARNWRTGGKPEFDAQLVRLPIGFG